ncbi:MAG: helix-turn-helix domain-containing protein [Lachnospiraceae bacterium]|nr:helix-turn-helix domain-containing protein [Lachnospiraceae bacterium]
MEYLTATEIAEKWGISSRRVRILCNEGRVKGAITKGNLWLIPYNTDKPQEQRRGRKNDTAACG